ncbi:MAG: hypothetical protein BAJALOKI2v1_890008 [Promethearchaeota archaeon]|nr:MAG: hypothetical protein BAJALOKI2v1_890008 [Candidatus Lokiarchaeota archaeon]
MMTNNKNWDEDVHVFIKKEAFRNMITHVLKYGHKNLEKKAQVLGVCIGKLASNGKTVELVNCLPLIHGDAVEEEFSEELKNFIDQLDKKYQEKNLNIYGYYHSHIGFGLFYSDTDIKNQQFFELKQSPFDFGIVFDPTEMDDDGDLGFRVFKLNEKATDFQNVNYKLEIPNSLDFFTWCKKLMEDYQKESPVLIREVLEKEEGPIGQLQEIPKSEDIAADFKEEPSESENDILRGFQEGVDQFKDTFMTSLTNQLNLWIDNLSSETTKGTKLLLNITNQMNNNLSYGITKIRKGFERNQEEILTTQEDGLIGTLQDEIENIKTHKTELEEFSENLIKERKSQINNFLSGIKESLQAITETYKNTLNLSSNKVNEITNGITNFSGVNNSISNTLEEFTNSINQKFKEKTSLFQSKTEEKISSIDRSLDDVMQKQNNLRDDIKSLKKEIRKFD